jgi:hypothetical protein
MSSENDNFLFSIFTKNMLDSHKFIRLVGKPRDYEGNRGL